MPVDLETPRELVLGRVTINRYHVPAIHIYTTDPAGNRVVAELVAMQVDGNGVQVGDAVSLGSHEMTGDALTAAMADATVRTVQTAVAALSVDPSTTTIAALLAMLGAAPARGAAALSYYAGMRDAVYGSLEESGAIQL